MPDKVHVRRDGLVIHADLNADATYAERVAAAVSIPVRSAAYLARAVRTVTTAGAQLQVGDARGLHMHIAVYVAGGGAFTLTPYVFAVGVDGTLLQYWIAPAATVVGQYWYEVYPGATGALSGTVAGRLAAIIPRRLYLLFEPSGGSWDYQVNYDLLP